MSEHCGPRGPVHRRLLFETLHRHQVDYVVIGGFAAIAHGSECPTADIDLTIARTIPNCVAFQGALLTLEARRCLSPRDRIAVERGLSPIRWLDGRFFFDTDAGGVDLHLPRYVFGCPPYLELHANSSRRLIGDDLEVRVASLDHLSEMKHAFGLDWSAWDCESLRLSGSERVLAA